MMTIIVGALTEFISVLGDELFCQSFYQFLINAVSCAVLSLRFVYFHSLNRVFYLKLSFHHLELL